MSKSEAESQMGSVMRTTKNNIYKSNNKNISYRALTMHGHLSKCLHTLSHLILKQPSEV